MADDEKALAITPGESDKAGRMADFKSPLPEAIEALILAARTQVARGHFRELYEGFNDCPGGNGDLTKCDCGYREAAIALRLLGEDVPDA